MQPGSRFREAVANERPLKVVGVFHPAVAMLVQRAGFKAAYLSGSGVAAAYGLPDLGMISMTEVVAEARRITAAVPNLPLLVDVDTGFGSELNVERCVRELIHAGAAACHIEDQEGAKRCGHRPGKRVVPAAEMVARVRAAAAARREASPAFYVIARTDAFAVEGLDETIERCKRYADAGADAIFPEAIVDLEHYAKIAEAVDIPVLANITEFGKTPIYTQQQLHSAGVRIVLYPLTLFRVAMGAAARAVHQLQVDGTQEGLLETMMTRQQFYDLIHYAEYEERLDQRGEE
ncbi:MAG: methylisocitrate lyase [Candidatus Sumerlaeia bacterium]|nr:methylisocitrate lyase [Candidatus Sumerlaeia bacterium]